MEAIENIHKALLQLRDSLTHLNSAREQVSQVTAESKEIIDATARLADDVRLLAEKISEETQTVITRFEDRLNEAQAGLTGVINEGKELFAAEIAQSQQATTRLKTEVEKTLQMISSYSGGQDLISMLLPRSVRDYFTNNRTWGNLSRNLSIDKVIENTKLILDQVGGIINSTLSVFSWGFVFLMGIVYFIFILLDFENLGRGIISLFPVSLRPMMRTVFSDLDRYMNSYFRGQALVALSVGVLLSIGFNIIGLPMATAMGIFIGLLNFIPYMQALGIVPLGLAGLLMAAQNGENVFVCLLLAYGVLIIVQIIQDMILVPRIMGHTMGMRPSLILLVLTIWGSLLGFFGMLIALPATMFLYSFYKRYILEDKEYIAEVEERARQKAERRKKKSTSRHKTKASNPSDGEDESL